MKDKKTCFFQKIIRRDIWDYFVLLMMFTGILFVITGLLLCPLWVWLANGHSIYNENGSELSFWLSFIGTVSAISISTFLNVITNK